MSKLSSTFLSSRSFFPSRPQPCPAHHLLLALPDRSMTVDIVLTLVTLATHGILGTETKETAHGATTIVNAAHTTVSETTTGTIHHEVGSGVANGNGNENRHDHLRRTAKYVRRVPVHQRKVRSPRPSGPRDYRLDRVRRRSDIAVRRRSGGGHPRRSVDIEMAGGIGSEIGTLTETGIERGIARGRGTPALPRGRCYGRERMKGIRNDELRQTAASRHVHAPP